MVAKSWTGLSGALWSGILNWTPNGAAVETDDALIAGPASGSLLVAGTGAAKSLTLTGNTALSGSVHAGSFTVGTGMATGALTLSGGAVLTANTGTVIYGPLVVSGAGTRLVMTGLLTVGGTRANAYAHGDDSLAVSQAAAAQLGGLLLLSTFGQVSVTVDATSSLEVGTLGGAGAGQITVDAGAGISGTGTLTAAKGVLNQGTITGGVGGLTINGGVIGGGSLSIAAGGQISLLSGASSEAVGFAGAGGTLEVASVYVPVGGVLTFTLSQRGVINGFVPGETIYYFGTGPLSSVSYAAGSGSLGTLTLLAGTRVVGTLSLAGDFTGKTFQVTPHGTAGSDVTVVASPAGGGIASIGTAAPDAYVWVGGAGGAWGNAANWQDVTAGQNPAVIAPGVHDSVTITGASGTGYSVFAGPANAAGLVALGHVALNGAFSLGAVTVGSSAVAGGLSVGAGSTLAASSLAVLNGPVQAIGAGSRIAVSGAAVLGGITAADLSQGSADLLGASVGAVVQVGQLTLNASLIADQVQVDAASSLEVGSAGGAALGLLTVDAGSSLAGPGR